MNNPIILHFRKASFVIISLGAVIFFSSCAQVTFHPGLPGALQQPDLSARTGLKYYSAKPYILVSYTGAKDSPVKIDLISLPDLEHPVYAVFHPGWGQHIFSLAVGTNGTLSSYGQTADSKGPETISALGGLLSGAGAAATGAGALIHPQAEHPSTVMLIEFAEKELDKILTKDNQKEKLFQNVKEDVDDWKTKLDNIKIGVTTGMPGQEDSLNAIAASIEAEVTRIKGDTSDTAANLTQLLTRAGNFVTKAAESLKGTPSAAPSKPDFKLFEIRMEAGVTKLVLVDTAIARAIVQGMTNPYGK
jgi:hypothetical protein